MSKLILSFLVLLSSVTYSQPGDTAGGNRNEPLNTDSILTVSVQRKDSQLQQAIDNNMNYILRLQKENKAKQRKAATARIAIGVGLLAVLVIGLRRRAKK